MKTRNEMENLNNEQIIAKFKMAFISIKESDCQKRDKGMIVTIHPDYGIKLFPTYYTAYYFYNKINLL